MNKKRNKYPAIIGILLIMFNAFELLCLINLNREIDYKGVASFIGTFFFGIVGIIFIIMYFSQKTK